jgi:hypothetical protein
MVLYASFMASRIKNVLRGGLEYLAPNGFTSHASGFSKAPEGQLFPKVDPELDGPECEHDCQTCTTSYPRKFEIDEEERLYGHVKGWSTHMVVATGVSDWVRDVEDVKGSVMEAVRECGVKPGNGVSTPFFLSPILVQRSGCH